VSDEIFDGDKLPEDLKWIMSHFGLPKDVVKGALLASGTLTGTYAMALAATTAINVLSARQPVVRPC